MRIVLVMGSLLAVGCKPATTSGVPTEEINVVLSATTDGAVTTNIEVVAELTRADFFENPLSLGSGDRFVATHVGYEVELEETETGVLAGDIPVDGTDENILQRPINVEFLRDSGQDATDTVIRLPEPFDLTVTDDRGQTLDEVQPNLRSTPLLISWTNAQEDAGDASMQLTLSTNCDTNTFTDTIDDSEGSFELSPGALATTDESLVFDCALTIEAMRKVDGTIDTAFASEVAVGQQRREATGTVDLY